MREYLYVLIIAAAVTYILTPLVRRFAIAINAQHAPRSRDVHTAPTPLLGGLAMYAGLAAADFGGPWRVVGPDVDAAALAGSLRR